MDDGTFRCYASLIYTHSGIALGESKRELVKARVAKRMRALGIADYQDYYQYVIQDPAGEELALLLDVISTNVTSFFREGDHFDFISSAIKAWYARGQRKFRLWSAGCSTGEEPFSLAMTFLESLPGEKADIKILATDISRQALEIARTGIYEKKKLDQYPMQRDRYFKSIGQSQVTVNNLLKHMVIFNYLNLQGKEYPFQGPFDAIFCRNVMIYFDDKGRSDIVNRFHKLLRPDGYLLVGHAESLVGMIKGFQYVRPSIYQKQSAMK
jgi:chemotaxis protein methyltransferase CheR